MPSEEECSRFASTENGASPRLSLVDRDLVLFGEFQQLGAAGQVPFAPGGDDRHVGLQRVIGELEANLVVALAGRAMGDRIGADLFGDLDLALGDQRAGDRGAEQILALIERIGAEHREDEVAHEGLAQVVHEDLLDAEHLGLAAGGLQFLALAEIGGEGHDLAAIGRLQPAQDHAGIQPARIGEHDFLDGFRGHVGLRSLSMARRHKGGAGWRQAPASRYGCA